MNCAEESSDEVAADAGMRLADGDGDETVVTLCVKH